ncbi:MAG: hypothetical protein AVDCRST_MAG45-1728 [uncultured Solirubrobacterales bacterium]|uniref:PsbP C-terminal domain-containing protein n=1 Tax=uncultured Solirubrobacterales bacterium TaxID=768556 RepID=A0A6J4SXV3_9ACTN|nr:MAG: hypothetical protein AVDCRST_MAG45-1728 [uncultured Solirubrobacterales bacterium]
MPDGRGRFPSRRWLIATAAVAAVVAVGVGLTIGGAAGERVGSGLPRPASQPPQPPTPTPAPGPAADEPPPGFVRFSDRQSRFSIAYPADWASLGTPSGGVDLLVTRERAASLLVRSLPLAFEVEARELPAARRLTDRIVASGRRVKLLAEVRRIELGGLPGWFYFYSFRDASGRRGTHSHYFLFRGSTLITLVLQALPAGDFPRYAPTFDAIAATFRATAAP